VTAPREPARAKVRRVVLVRHAHAHAVEPGLEDFERRLDKRGRREAEAMARRAHELELVPDHLIASPADRALETAREFAKALGFPLPRIRHDDRVYLAEPAQLVAILRSVPNDVRTVMLVGHNPGISRLAEWLTGDDVGDLPTAAIYAASGELDRWHDLARDTFERTARDHPR
jgi:phosphohistidine phosphatase